jgi:methionyl-tRNA formyltransferase
MMRILFCGSGAFGLPTLEALHREHKVVAVVSQPDRPAGRKRVMTPTPIAAWAASQGLRIYKSENVNQEDFVKEIAECNADASVVIAFGQKLSPELIAAMGELTVNLHASLLPAYRGAAPIQRAMIDDLATTGVSVIGLAQKMDAGEIYATSSLDIDPLETAGELHDRLAQLGPDTVGQVLNDLKNADLQPLEQDHAAATPAPKFIKSDGTVDFHQPAEKVRARIHGLTPWPGCRVLWQRKSAEADPTEPTPIFLRRVRSLKSEATPRHDPGEVYFDESWRVACSIGSLELLELQAPGGKTISAEDFANGQGLKSGDRFTSA